MLSVRLLGGLAVEWRNTPLPVFPGKIARSLFAYLLVHRDHAHTRDLLAGTFWPELPEATARRRLSQALWQIRHGLRAIMPEAPSPLILAEGDTLQVNPDFPLHIDVDDFRHHVNQASSGGNNALAHDAAGVALYQGDFLEGYYDDWIVARREQLRLQLLESLARLVDGYKRAGDYEHALTYARRLVMEEPWDEAGHREIMRLYHLLGREAEALKQFKQCRAFLTAELNAAPAPETVALAREIAQRSDFEVVSDLPAAAPASFIFDSDQTPQLPLVGREAERTALLTHVEASMQGLAGLVLVEGEAGVGKTRLLQTLAHDAEWRGVTVLWGAGREVARATSYAPLVQALSAQLTSLRVNQLTQLVASLWLQVLKSLLSPLAMLLPDLAAPPKLDPAQEQNRLAAAFAHVLGGWSQITPLVLILEDLHWASADTLSLVAQVLPRLENRRLLIIGSYRSTEARAIPGVWEQLQALDRAGVVLRLTLSGLDAVATGELIRRSLGLTGTAPLFEARLYQETQGNPLFVLETLRALHSEGLLTQDQSGGWITPWDDTTVDYTELPLPQAVEQTILRRLRLLSPVQRRFIHLAAILGEHVDFDVLRAAWESEPQTMLAALRELVRYRFLEETMRDYRFSHDKIRQVAYADIDAPARLALHRQVAQIIETLHPEQVVALAHHWTQAEGWEQAADYYRQAGDQARAVYANTDAVAHYTQALAALAHLSDATKQTYDVLLAREALYDMMGKREAQAEDLQALETLVSMLDDATRRGEIAVRKVNYAETLGDFPTAIEAAGVVIQLGQTAGDRHLQAEGHLYWGHVLLKQNYYDDARPHYETALKLADEAALHALKAASLRGLSSLALNKANYVEARTYTEQCLYISRNISNALEEGIALDHIGLIACRQGNYSDATQHHEQALRIFREVGDRKSEGIALHHLGLVAVRSGNPAEAQTFYQQALSIYHSIGDRLNESTMLNNVGIVFGMQGNYAKARDALEQALYIDTELGRGQTNGNALHNLGLVCRLLGDYASAKDYYQRSLKINRGVGDKRGEATTLGNLGSVSRCLGDYQKALSYHQQALAIFRQIGDPKNESDNLTNLGRAYHHLGDYAEAQRRFEQALCLSRQINTRQEEAESLGELSLLCHHLGDNRNAQVQAQQALQIVGEVGDRSTQGQTLTRLGHALAGLNRLTEAAAAYRQALALHHELGQPYLAAEALAGLARVAFAQGKIADAWAYIDEILSYLESGTLDGAAEPFRVYLTCYRICRSGADPRAEAVLVAAHDLLQERVAKIDKAALRRSFLENVTAHRELIAAYQTLQVPLQEKRILVSLPRADSSPGRPLRYGEYVSVTWTLVDPRDEAIEGKVERRRHRLLRLLNEAQTQGALPCDADLAKALDVSLATVRRDVAALRAAGHVLPPRRRKRTA